MFRLKHIIVSFVLLCGISGHAATPDSLPHREFERAGIAPVQYLSTLKTYKDYLQHYNPERAAIWFDENGRFNSDILFLKIAVNDEDVRDELHYYITEVMTYMPPEEREAEIKKMREYARRYKNEETAWLADLQEAFIPVREYPEQDRNELLEKLSQRYRKNFTRYVMIREEMFRIAVVDRYYSDAFRLAAELSKELEKVSEKEYPSKKGVYYILGELYYMFRDYEKAVPLLEKSIADTVRYFSERQNFQARNTLGLYYRSQGDLDKSDGYFLSMLASPDIVKFRPMYDAMAIANLGRNYMLREDYAEALKLLRRALPVAVKQNDYTFAGGVTADMGSCYLALGLLEKVKDMIDTTVIYMHVIDPFYSRNTNLKLYPLMSKYYGKIGNDMLAAAYLDSTVYANKRYEDEFSALTMMKVEQELHNAEQAVTREQIRSRNNQLMWAGALLLAISAGAVVLALFYKRKRDAYKELVRKSQQWAGLNEQTDNFDEDNAPHNNALDEDCARDDCESDAPDAADMAVMEGIDKLMKRKKPYVSPVFSLNMLSAELGIDRRYVSGAINRCAKKHFSAYVNEYRVKEAIRIMSQADTHHTIDNIAFESGFNDRKTFHRIFKQYTGVTPATFRTNL